MKKILVIEDNEAMIGSMGRAFWLLNMEPTFARTLDEAEEALTTGEFDIIAVDGCLNSREINTLPLVRRISARYTGPLIAISSESSFNEQLVAAGCSHSCPKYQFPLSFRKELGI